VSYSERAPHAEFLELIVAADVAGAGLEAQRLCTRLGLLAFYDDVVEVVIETFEEQVRRHKLTAAEMYTHAAAVQAAAATAYELVPWPARTAGTVVVACAPHERHGFGARVAADAFALAGWRDVFLGPGLDVQAIAAAVTQHDASVLALSITLKTNVEGARETVERARRARPDLRVVIGGKAVRGFAAADLNANAVALSAREARDVACTFRRER
jgi:methanogenic corrinoid protein MtbC1